ncbi:AAA family ATPase [Natronorubrum sp. A-ect3]|uniref:AAA family ATPase n=1 Tax=Natronorubrum sp. A-ect3 TaxID=3242698 RepID=UPI00359E6D32
MRDSFRESYFKHGQWKTASNVVVALFGFFGLYLVFGLTFTVLLTPLDAVSSIDSDSGLTFSVLAALGMVAYAGWNARSDVKRRYHTYELQERPTVDAAADAYSYLNARDEETRNNAVRTIALASEDAPGKVVKAIPDDVELIVSKLVELLDDEYHHVQGHAAAALGWFSRDYTDVVLEHAEAIELAMNTQDSEVRSELVVVLGNLGVAAPDRADEFAKAIAPAVSDEDPEVRHSAAIGLGMLPCDRAVNMLEDLSQDQNPHVREQASQALQEHLSQGEPQHQSPEETPQHGSGSNEETGQTETRFVTEPPTNNFDDIAGMDDLKTRLRENVIEPFEGGDVFEKFSVAADSGILLHGPPGTGKTHAARCLAGELEANYAEIDVGDIESKWIGEGVENLKQLFAEARANQPCLVFIDELDALASDRSGQQHEDKKKMVNQLLQELSNIESDDELLVVGATNKPDAVDDAILRPGRFDAKIELPKPDGDARWQIFESELTAPSESVPRDKFVRKTSGYSASDVVEVVRRAARRAANRERQTDEETIVTADDVFVAIDEVGTERGDVGEFVRQPPSIDFSDVAGMDKLKETLHETVIDPLENPKRYEEFGIGVERGFLLYGPPGTGKTHVSKALAGELGINYVEARASDLVSKWTGGAAENVQRLFAEARENQPCLVFIDELDALASDRSGHQTKSERQMVNQFLEELTTLNDGEHDVIVVAATNRPNEIDNAMLRSGRLGEQIEVPPPEASTRVELFYVHLDAPVGDIDDRWLAESTDSFVASDIAHLATETARIAMRRTRDGDGDASVTQQDLEEAVNKLTA